ncbi:MAG TPA: LLM class flavin-dependent oxidoreductase [Pyrinomonadaceae bacterium]
MDHLHEKLKALSPAQRLELERRLKEKNGAATKQESSPEAPVEPLRQSPNKIDFSLFFFSGDGSAEASDKYRLVLEGAKFADGHDFKAVWTPERHFQPFGGLYPNPSVLSAAIAAVTRRIQIRAGSVVLPLHDPVRIAEEWSIVDNLSGGRVEVSFASGWHPADFALAPDAYESRKALMFAGIETVKCLWSGQSVSRRSVGDEEVQLHILPRPIQPELPVWISIARNPDTWIRAGEIGAHVLTAIVKQPLEELSKKIQLYREARERSGFDPESGRVATMLHTFVGDDEQKVKAIVKPSLCAYFRANLKQLELQTSTYARSSNARAPVEVERITDEDLDSLAEHAFERYYDQSLLCGTPTKCAQLVEQLANAGVNEIACLVDYGPSFSDVMESLRHLDFLRAHFSGSKKA